MSNALLNAHIAFGEPCGENAEFVVIADWAGELLLADHQELLSRQRKSNPLIGRRFRYRGERPDGVIVSEAFRAETRNEDGYRYEATCVAVLWDDNDLEGAVDVELLELIEE